jgi:hypothetical protein
MNKQLLLSAVLVTFAIRGLPAVAAECQAARTMTDGMKDLETRKELIQRQEWLLLEYLASDGSKSSRKLLTQEVEKSAQRTREMVGYLGELTALPADTPPIPEEGTPACGTMTRVHGAVMKLLDQRTAEIKKYYEKTYKFLWGCDNIAVQLVGLGDRLNSQDVKPETARMVRLTADIMMGPYIANARLQPDEFQSLANEVFAPSTLPGRTRYAYTALRCLRNYQRQEVASLPAATPALAKCDATQWQPLGQCVAEATRL